MPGTRCVVRVLLNGVRKIHSDGMCFSISFLIGPYLTRIHVIYICTCLRYLRIYVCIKSERKWKHLLTTEIIICCKMHYYSSIYVQTICVPVCRFTDHRDGPRTDWNIQQWVAPSSEWYIAWCITCQWHWEGQSTMYMYMMKNSIGIKLHIP